MKFLIKVQQESCENANLYYICKETFDNKYLKDKKYHKVRDQRHCTWEYRGAGHSIFKLEFFENICIAFYNGSNCDCHFMIKELAEEFKNQFTCLGENTEKYITFITFPNREVTRTYKIGEQVIKNIPYVLQFTDGAGFMVR